MTLPEVVETAPKTTTPVAEVGYVTPSLGGSIATDPNWADIEETPELRWPLCVPVYRRMRRQDAQITSVLRAVMLPIRRTPWRIDPAGARPEVVEHLAADTGLPIKGADPAALNGKVDRTVSRFSFAEHLHLALLSLVYGHMFFEQVYRVGDDGLYHLRKLGVRPPDTIADIRVARDGGLLGIQQHAAGLVDVLGPQVIPVQRLAAYVHDREGADWTGNSLLRPAYKHWLIKDRLLRVQAQTIERNGMGVPVYEAGPNDDQAQLEAGRRIAQSYKAGSASGAALPYEAHLRLLGVEGNLPDANPAIKYHDEQIGRAVLAHFLNLGQNTGSYALGSSWLDFFVLSLQTEAEFVRDTFQAHVLDDLVTANWGPTEPAPRIVFDEIGTRQQATAIALKTLIDSGVITVDEALEQATRQDYGLPAKPAGAAPAPAPEPAAAALRRGAPRARIESDGALTLW